MDSYVLKMVTNVAIYADWESFERDRFGKLQGGQLKPVHDELFQRAISLKLATHLVMINLAKRSPGFAEKCSVAVKRPLWWPARTSEPSRKELLIAPLRTFDNSWMNLRAAAEAPTKAKSNRPGASIWSDDPALVFTIPGNQFLCRIATVSHEGHVFYFVYPKEREWEAALAPLKLDLFGKGRSAYERLLKVPGAIGGWE